MWEATSAEEIRNAYKERAMLHHPDRGGDAANWANIQRAYDTLSDVRKRMHSIMI